MILASFPVDDHLLCFDGIECDTPAVYICIFIWYSDISHTGQIPTIREENSTFSWDCCVCSMHTTCLVNQITLVV